MIRWPIDEVLAEQAHVRRQMSSVPPPAPDWEGSGGCLLCLETVSVAERDAAYGNAYHEECFRCSECGCTLTASRSRPNETDELKRRMNSAATYTESETSNSLSTSSAEADLKAESAERDASARLAAQSLLAGIQLAGARGLRRGEAPLVQATDASPVPFEPNVETSTEGDQAEEGPIFGTWIKERWESTVLFMDSEPPVKLSTAGDRTPEGADEDPVATWLKEKWESTPTAAELQSWLEEETNVMVLGCWAGCSSSRRPAASSAPVSPTSPASCRPPRPSTESFERIPHLPTYLPSSKDAFRESRDALQRDAAGWPAGLTAAGLPSTSTFVVPPTEAALAVAARRADAEVETERLKLELAAAMERARAAEAENALLLQRKYRYSS